MKGNFVRRCLAVGMIVLFFGMFLSSSATQIELKNFVESTRGNILYVGGNGSGNYTKIQDAVDNASSGDTIFVYNGTYYEHIAINKQLFLI